MYQHLQLIGRAAQACSIAIGVDKTLNAIGYRKTVGFNLLNCVAVKWRKVCSRHDELQLERRVVHNRLEYGTLKKILRAYTCDREDATFGHLLYLCPTTGDFDHIRCLIRTIQQQIQS